MVVSVSTHTAHAIRSVGSLCGVSTHEMEPSFESVPQKASFGGGSVIHRTAGFRKCCDSGVKDVLDSARPTNAIWVIPLENSSSKCGLRLLSCA